MIVSVGHVPRGAAPSDPLRQMNVVLSRRIAALGERDGVEFLDIADVFLTDDGGRPAEIMGDYLHPETVGYQRWAEAIAAPVARLLGESMPETGDDG